MPCKKRRRSCPRNRYRSRKNTLRAAHWPPGTRVNAALAAPECDHDEVALADPDRPQSLSARTSLHAGTRPKLVREASGRTENASL